MADSFKAAIELAFSTPGLDALPRAEDALREVGVAQRKLADDFKAGSVGAAEFAKQAKTLGQEYDKLQDFIAELSKGTAEYTALQAKLGQMEQDTARAAVQAAQRTADAKRDGTEAVQRFTRAVMDQKAASEKAQAQQDAAARAAVIAAKAAADAQVQAADRAAQAAAKVATANEEAAKKAQRGWSQAGLELSRTVEDVSTGGPIGGVNNAGRLAGSIAQGFGAAASTIVAVEAALGGVATAAFIVYQNWDRIKGLFDDGLGSKLIPDLEALQKNLKELKAQGPISLIAIADIERAEKAVELAERLEAAKKAQGGQTQEDKKQAEIFNEGVREATRATPGAIDKVIMRARENEQSPELKAIREEYWRRLRAAQADDRQTGNGNLAENEFLNEVAPKLRKREQAQIVADAKNRPLAAANLRALAGTGNEAALRALADILAKNQDFARNQGIDVPRLSKAIADAQAVPKNYNKEEEQAAEREQKKADEVAQRNADRQSQAQARQLDQYVRDRVAVLKSGFDDALEKAIFDAVKGGATPEAARAGARPGLVAGLRGRGVSDEAVDRVADAILGSAADRALNVMGEGGKPRLDVKADAAKLKADNERQQQVNAQVTRVGSGFDENLNAAILRRVAEGGDAAGALAPLQQQIGDRLGARGVPADLRADVARTIAQRQIDRTTNDLQGRNDTGDMRGNARDALVDLHRKAQRRDASEEKAARRDDHEALAGGLAGEFQRRTGANDLVSNRAGEIAAKVMQSGQDSEYALQAAFTQILGAMQAQEQSNRRVASLANRAAAQAGQIHGNQQRNRQRRPSLIVRP